LAAGHFEKTLNLLNHPLFFQYINDIHAKNEPIHPSNLLILKRRYSHIGLGTCMPSLKGAFVLKVLEGNFETSIFLIGFVIINVKKK
jgi:hypothetical protein